MELEGVDCRLLKIRFELHLKYVHSGKSENHETKAPIKDIILISDKIWLCK